MLFRFLLYFFNNTIIAIICYICFILNWNLRVIFNFYSLLCFDRYSYWQLRLWLRIRFFLFHRCCYRRLWLRFFFTLKFWTFFNDRLLLLLLIGMNLPTLWYILLILILFFDLIFLLWLYDILIFMLTFDFFISLFIRSNII